MKLEEQYKMLQELKKEIDSKLKDLDFNKIKELLLWLAGSKEYQKLKMKDNQLSFLELFTEIWLREKKFAKDFVMQGDIFYGVYSLADIERKYLSAKFAFFRIEKGLPYECCVSAVQEIIAYQYSAYALYTVIVNATEKKQENIVRLAQLLKEQNEMVKAIGLLQKGVEKYPNNEEIVLELADCWLDAQQWERAYDCLCQIEKPTEQIRGMIEELEKVIGHETL